MSSSLTKGTTLYLGAHVPRQGDDGLQPTCGGFDSHRFHLKVFVDFTECLIVIKSTYAPLAQGFRAFALQAKGRWFESTTEYHMPDDPGLNRLAGSTLNLEV